MIAIGATAVKETLISAEVNEDDIRSGDFAGYLKERMGSSLCIW